MYNSTVACDFLLVCFPPALLLCIENYSAMKKSNYETVSFNWNAETYLSFFYDFLYLFCRVAEVFLQILLLSNGCFINSVAPATSTCHHTSTIFLNSQFPSYLHLYITLCCPHHDVNIISTPLRLVIAHFTQIYVDRHFVYLFEKKRERSFWIGNSLSHLQCCCLMQLLLLGWKTSWMVNEYNMQIVVEWQMVLWCKK